MCVLCKHRDILCTTSKFRNLILTRHHFLIYLLHSIIADCPLRPFYSTHFPHRRITHRIEMLLPAPLPEASPQSSWLREAGEEVHSRGDGCCSHCAFVHWTLSPPKPGHWMPAPWVPVLRGEWPLNKVLKQDLPGLFYKHLHWKEVFICLPQSTPVEGTASPGRWEGKKQGQLGLGAVLSSVLGAPEGVSLDVGTYPMGNRVPQHLKHCGDVVGVSWTHVCVWVCSFQGRSGDRLPSCGLWGLMCFQS